MSMTNIDREDIHIVSQHSNWSEQGVKNILKNNIYNDADAWHKFLKLFFLSVGVAFTVAGILFFFAYNWNDLHKFTKIGLIEGLIIVLTLVVLFSKINENFKNILLAGVSVLVGVLFAVFGQVYQTGANAYDFFLGWTMAITLWVIISNFPPLWLIFITLINTTFILYTQQVVSHWSDIVIPTILFVMNSLFLIGLLTAPKFINGFKAPNWLTNSVALFAVTCATAGIIFGIFDEDNFTVLAIITLIAFTAGILYGLKTKRTFYFTVIPLSIIIMITALIIRVADSFEVLLGVGLFVVISITIVIKFIMGLQKKWRND